MLSQRFYHIEFDFIVLTKFIPILPWQVVQPHFQLIFLSTYPTCPSSDIDFVLTGDSIRKALLLSVVSSH